MSVAAGGRCYTEVGVFPPTDLPCSSEPFMSTIALTKDNFDDVVTKNDMVIVDFWASWCGPCRAFAPTFEAASEQHADIVFGKVDTEEQQELAAAFNIRSIPTLMVLRENVILYSEAGALPASALANVISQAKQIDMAEVHREIAARESESKGEGSGNTADPS